MPRVHIYPATFLWISVPDNMESRDCIILKSFERLTK